MGISKMEINSVGRYYCPITLWSFLGGFIWGGLAALSSLSAYEDALKGFGVIIFVLFCIPFVIRYFRKLFGISFIIWMAVFSAYAAISGILHGSHYSVILKYIMPLPACIGMVALCFSGKRARAYLYLGVMLSSILFWGPSLVDIIHGVGFSEQQTDRIRPFSSSNFIAFSAVMAGLTAFGFALTIKDNFAIKAIMFGISIMAIPICYATKSRTATVSLIVGIIAALCVRVGLKRLLLAVIFVLPFIWFVPGSKFGERISWHYGLFEGKRSIYQASGRYELWSDVVIRFWLDNIFTGLGPDRNIELCIRNYGHNGIHNGFLALLVDFGIIGFLPIIFLVRIVSLGLIASTGEKGMVIPISILIAGLTTTMAEIQFISVGNPGSILFLLSMIILSLKAKGGLRDLSAGIK